VEVDLPPEKEDRVRQFAIRAGKDAGQVIEEAVDRLLADEAAVIADVEVGRASSRRGDLLEHDEVVRRIEQILNP
jgi:predicted transcriptional regulator